MIKAIKVMTVLVELAFIAWLGLIVYAVLM